MRTLIALSVFLSTSAFAVTQTIQCFQPGALVKVTFELNSANKIQSGEVEISGRDLAPQLYRGQSFGADISKEDLSVVNGGIVMKVNSWDPSADDPISFEVGFPKSIIGKNLKKGSFELYIDEYTMEKSSCYSFVK